MPSKGKPVDLPSLEYMRLPEYFEDENAEAGDVVIQFDQHTRIPIHCNLMARDASMRIHSVTKGVIMSRSRASGPAVVYRCPYISKIHHPGLAASQVAEEWVDKSGYSKGFDRSKNQGMVCGQGRRAFNAAIFSHKFGLGATARLAKYRKRMDKGQLAVNNMICSELVVLAYQLSSSEKDQWFIRLDAKHTTPWTLEHYLYRNWDVVARCRSEWERKYEVDEFEREDPFASRPTWA